MIEVTSTIKRDYPKAFRSARKDRMRIVWLEARELVKTFWISLPEHYRTLWLLEGPCEALTEAVFAGLLERVETRSQQSSK